MISRKSNLNPHIAININKAMETEFLEMSLDCCNCDQKSGIETELWVHLLMKHGKLNLVTVIPDRGKLDAHKLQVSNGKIASIQILVANCDKCSPTSVFRSYFGLHIQTSHEPSVSSLFSVGQDEMFTANAVDLWTMPMSLQSVQRITPPPSLQTLLTLLFTLPASTLFRLTERSVFYLLYSLGASDLRQ